jgi:hypothetical protein
LREEQVTVDPSLHSHPSTTGEMQFDVIATATMKPTVKERKWNKNAEPVVLEAKQSWRVKILAPHKKAEFIKLDVPVNR